MCIRDSTAIESLGKLGFRQPGEAIKRLAELRASSRYLQLPTTNRSRLDAIGPRLIEAAGSTPDPDTTLARSLQFIESISRRGAYLALLQQYPMALRRVADMAVSYTHLDVYKRQISARPPAGPTTRCAPSGAAAAKRGSATANAGGDRAPGAAPDGRPHQPRRAVLCQRGE